MIIVRETSRAHLHVVPPLHRLIMRNAAARLSGA